MSSVEFTICDPQGREVASETVAVNSNELSERKLPVVRASLQVDDVMTWSAETPVLYTLKVASYNKKGQTEQTAIKIGFRTLHIEKGQFFVNGQPVLIKGVNRHEMNAYKGYLVT